MKKSIFILALLAIIATGAFAQWFSFPMAAGGGLLFDLNGKNGIEGTVNGNKGALNLDILSFGGFGFFDATYAELDVSFAYGSLTSIAEEFGHKTMEKGDSALQLGFTLLGKYPIELGSFTVFPLLGFDYNMWLSVNKVNRPFYDTPGDSDMGIISGNPGDNNQFGILAGAGLDFPLDFLSDSLFLRIEAMFHLRFPSKASKDLLNTVKSENPYSSLDTTLGTGPRIQIGVGYKF